MHAAAALQKKELAEHTRICSLAEIWRIHYIAEKWLDKTNQISGNKLI
jgi:hypothetical protein